MPAGWWLINLLAEPHEKKRSPRLPMIIRGQLVAFQAVFLVGVTLGATLYRRSTIVWKAVFPPRVYIYVYIYIYVPESYSLYHFWLLESYFLCHSLSKITSLPAATSKVKFRNCTTRKLFSGAPQGCILPPPRESGTVPNSLGGTFSNFIFALCFPICETSCGFFGFSKDELKTQVGTSVVQFVAFSYLGVWFSYITCLLID